MREALKLAKKAQAKEEVPVGAVVVLEDKIIGYAYNRTISLCDPTAHAEVLALRKAAKNIGNYRLLDSSLYATIEPCAMCAGAIINARIKRLIYGAPDPKAGGIASIFQIGTSAALNHQVEVVAGVLEEECRDLIQLFFRRKRNPEG